jgi:hypothetical protein
MILNGVPGGGPLDTWLICRSLILLLTFLRVQDIYTYICKLYHPYAGIAQYWLGCGRDDIGITTVVDAFFFSQKLADRLWDPPSLPFSG